MDKVSKLGVLAIPFSIVVSTCYLWAYWSTFEIDIFSYLTASEILVLSVIPFLGSGIFSLFGIIIGDMSRLFLKNSEKTSSTKIKVVRAGFKISDVLLLAFIISLLVFGGPSKWLVIPMLFSILITFLLIIMWSVHSESEPTKLHITLVFVATLLPFQAYGFGKLNALNLKEGNAYKYVVNDVSGVPTSNEKLRYIGKAGTDLFLYHASKKEIVIISRSSLDPLRLANYEKPVPKKETKENE